MMSPEDNEDELHRYSSNLIFLIVQNLTNMETCPSKRKIKLIGSFMFFFFSLFLYILHKFKLANEIKRKGSGSE